MANKVKCAGIRRFLHWEPAKFIFACPKLSFSINLGLFLVDLDEILRMQSSEIKNLYNMEVIRKYPKKPNFFI